MCKWYSTSVKSYVVRQSPTQSVPLTARNRTSLASCIFQSIPTDMSLSRASSTAIAPDGYGVCLGIPATGTLQWLHYLWQLWCLRSARGVPSVVIEFQVAKRREPRVGTNAKQTRQTKKRWTLCNTGFAGAGGHHTDLSHRLLEPKATESKTGLSTDWIRCLLAGPVEPT